MPVAVRKKTRHGATQPESSRVRQQKLVRLHPDSIAALKRMAARGGATESTLIEHAIVLLAETAAGDPKAYELAMRGREATLHQGDPQDGKAKT